MRIFFDTEFSGLGQRNPDLISAGFVTEDGQEFYIEVADFNQLKCQQFVRESVLPLLGDPAQRVPLADVGPRLSAWLAGFDQPIDLVSDSEHDGRLVMAALRDHMPPQGVLAIVHQVESHDALDAEFRFWQQPENKGKQHHAMFDARCLRYMRHALENEFKERMRKRK
jgi:hypothetical protein